MATTSQSPPIKGGVDGARTSGVVERVAELLEVTYRSADLGNVEDVLTETIYILLSLNTRERVYQRVFRELRKAYPYWAEVLAAPERELRALLRPAGLQEQRARKIKQLLARVLEDNLQREVGPAVGADITLDYLRDLSESASASFLLSLPGIGPKSANCILAYSLNHPRFAVDTHVERIFRRLGLVSSRRSPNSKVNHTEFESLVPPRLRKQLHINLIHHGRAVCQNRAAQCSSCVLVSFCDEGLKTSAPPASKAPVAIDLFAGAGGLGSGFREEGFRIALAVERDRNAAQTYRANNPGVPVLEADVASLTGKGLKKQFAGIRSVDVVLAGPPCQGYSWAGKRRPHDSKNRLFEQVARLAEELQSQLVVMENVPGLRRVNGVGFSEAILRRLRRSYDAEGYELRACEFGVPQERRRIFFLGRLRGQGAAPAPPKATHLPFGTPDTGLPETPSLEARLAGDLELGPGEDAEWRVLASGIELLNASTMKHGKAVIKKIAGIEPGKGPISYRRLERDVARTLVAGHRALPVHPWLDRSISVREAARIQAFPDSYVFCGPRAEQPLQVANAVPPPLARAVALELRLLLARTTEPVGRRPAGRRRGAARSDVTPPA
jgi:DNA (cytosine-5)-methyltransferase 1